MQSVIFFVASLSLATAFLLPSSVFRDLPHLGSRIQVKPPACNNQPIGQCTDDFFAHFGLADPHNETVFEQAVNQYLAQNGVNGLTNIRTWMQELYNCSGGRDNLNACVQWQMLMQNFNFTEDMAKKWQIEFLTLEYETGRAYNAMVRNWFCIGQVSSQEGPVIQACYQHFTDQQHNDPNHTCEHLAEYLYCIDRPYAQHCGREVGGLVCHIERIGYTVYFPDCESHVALHCQGAP